MHALMLGFALLAAAAGMAGLAVAMPAHWAQVQGGVPLRGRSAVLLRWVGGAGLLLSLVLCFAVDHASMAALVWVMTLAAAALGVALVLAWRPGWLRPLARIATAL